jgi:hypothetical protein
VPTLAERRLEDLRREALVPPWEPFVAVHGAQQGDGAAFGPLAGGGGSLLRIDHGVVCCRGGGSGFSVRDIWACALCVIVCARLQADFGLCISHTR